MYSKGSEKNSTKIPGGSTSALSVLRPKKKRRKTSDGVRRRGRGRGRGGRVGLLKLLTCTIRFLTEVTVESVPVKAV